MVAPRNNPTPDGGFPWSPGPSAASFLGGGHGRTTATALGMLWSVPASVYRGRAADLDAAIPMQFPPDADRLARVRDVLVALAALRENL